MVVATLEYYNLSCFTVYLLDLIFKFMARFACSSSVLDRTVCLPKQGRC